MCCSSFLVPGATVPYASMTGKAGRRRAHGKCRRQLAFRALARRLTTRRTKVTEGSNPDNGDAATTNKLRKVYEATKKGAQSYAQWSSEKSKRVDEKLHTAEWGTYARQGYASVRTQVQRQIDAQRARAFTGGTSNGAPDGAPTAEETAALDRYVHAVDWTAVSQAVTDQATDVAERARELVKDVDWEKVTPIAKKVAIGL